jgi:hypothetical protein
MNLNGSGDITKQQQLPNQVSSNSSLDSFLINLPSSSEHPLYMNIDDYGVQHSHTTDAEYELVATAAAATGRSSASLADFDGSDQSSRAFAFDADEVDHLGDHIEGVESDHPPSAQQPEVPRPMHGRRVSAPAAMSSSMVGNSSVPEFLYQLTKMLTDDNRDVIEWAKGKTGKRVEFTRDTKSQKVGLTCRTFVSPGRIEVHSPQKLESHVLKKYFRHSKVRGVAH